MTGYCADCGNTACICPVPDARPPQSALGAEQIAEIRARSDAATKGPWTTERAALDENRAIWGPDGICVGIAWHYHNARPNADFMAHARDDVPQLLAALEAAEQERDALRVDLAALREAFIRHRTATHEVTSKNCVTCLESDVAIAACQPTTLTYLARGIIAARTTPQETKADG